MDARVQRRVQRYGWDLAAQDYEPLWQAQLADARRALLDAAALAPGERVLDVACGTGLVALEAARAVGPEGHVVGVDLSDRMVDAARSRAQARSLRHADFARMDGEALALPDGGFDVALSALGLMYMPDPLQALREMRRVLRPGGRMVAAVWGERARCGWASVFPIVEAEVTSDVCPLFFGLGQQDALARLFDDAGCQRVNSRRIATTLDYADVDQACDAAFVGGPVALAWSRFDAGARARARKRYVASISPWRHGNRYEVPGEFVIVSGAVPGALR